MNISQLSGIDLRKQIAGKLGYSARNVEEDYDFLCKWALEFGPDRICGEENCGDSEELAWQSAPAFERDLGALQSSGILTTLLKAGRVAFAFNQWETDNSKAPNVDARKAVRNGYPDLWYGLAGEQSEIAPLDGEMEKDPVAYMASCFCRAFLAMNTDAK